MVLIQISKFYFQSGLAGHSMNLTAARKKLDKLLGQYETAKQNVRAEKQALRKAKQELENVSQALEICQTVAAGVQQFAHTQIASVVTRCLEAVFDDPYEFKIEFQRKRNKTEARLYFKRGDLEVSPENVGGSVIDVASFALRLACLMLMRPQPRKLLVLDEPMKHVSAAGRERVKELLQTLAKETGFQIILVTHAPELEAGKVINVG